MLRIAPRLLLVLLALCILHKQPAHAQVTPEKVALVEAALPATAPAKAKQPRHLLIFTKTQGFVHKSIPLAAKAIAMLGEKTGAFTSVESDDMSMFSAGNLGKFDAVCLVSTTQLTFEDPELRRSFLTYMKNGGGLIGIHAASDNFYNWHEAAEMLGGQFDGHPWTSGGTWDVHLEDPKHPAVKAFAGNDFSIKDEIYRIKATNLRQKARILMGLDMTTAVNQGAKGVRYDDWDIPIAWVKPYQRGRVFYSSLGHNDEVFWNADVLAHYLAGIQYALGDLQVDTRPLPLETDRVLPESLLDSLVTGACMWEYGKDRVALSALNSYIRLAGNYPPLHNACAEALTAALTGDATVAAKQYFAENLALIGSPDAGPALETLLANDATFEVGLFALEALGGEFAAKIIRSKLKTSSGKNLIALLAALGQTGSEKDSKRLGNYFDHADPAVSAAAISAASQIGGKDAFNRLFKFGKNTNRTNAALAMHASIAAASTLDGDAQKSLEKVYKSKAASSLQRFAVLRALIRKQPALAGTRLRDAVESGDASLAQNALSLISSLPAGSNITAILAAFPKLDTASKVSLLAGLGASGHAQGLQTVLQATASEHADVRLTAIQTLASYDGETVLTALLRTAATARGTEREAARTSIARLRGPNTDSELTARLTRSPVDERIEIIRAIDARYIKSAVPALLTAARDPERKVRLEASKALRSTAEPGALSAMIILLAVAETDAERSSLETTTAIIARKAENRHGSATQLAKAYRDAEAPERKRSYLRTLGKVGDPATYSLLETALQSDDIELRLAAIRAATDWPEPRPLDALFSIARQSGLEREQVLAVRGVVKLLGLPAERPDSLTIDLYGEAMQLARRPQEKRAILSGLTDQQTFAAFQFVSAYLDSSALASEAAAAVLQIGRHLRDSHSQQIKPAIVKLAAMTDAPETQRRIERLIDRIERFEDYINVWQYAGPFSAQGEDLFAFSFAPENAQTGSVKWQALQPDQLGDQKWMVNFEKLIGGDNRVAYLRNQVWAPAAQKLQMQVGSDDGVKVWVNGVVMHANDTSRGVSPGEDRFEVNLNAGWNDVLVKIVNGGGGWGFCGRFRSAKGKHVDGLKFRLPGEE